MGHLVFLDSTVLSNFALVRRPDLATVLWPGQACTVRAAMNEYLSAINKLRFPPEYWDKLPIIDLTAPEDEFARQLPARLGAGERACIAAAISRGGMFVSDDLDARRISRSRAVLLSGTLGILIGCMQRDLLTLQEANILLTRMIAAGYRSPISELKSSRGDV